MSGSNGAQANGSAGALHGQVAIVTGGAQGFGEGIVKRLVADGAKVLIVDMNAELGKSKAAEFGCTFESADVSKRDSWERILARVEQEYGRLDIICNNAGWTYPAKDSLTVTDTEFDRVFDVNCRAFYHSTNVCVPYLQKQGSGGSFITISSTAALRPRPNLTWYNASKGWVSTASKSLALELAKDKIRFNSVCPVAGNTPLVHSFAGKDGLTDEKRNMFVSTIPLGRLSEASDIGDAVAFLATQTFLTGVELPVDGGRCV